MTVPSVVQMIMLSMILQDLIDSKEKMEKVRTKLTEAYTHPEIQKWLIEMTKTSDFKVFNENIMKNKDNLVAFAN